jgi:hypothetical protein
LTFAGQAMVQRLCNPSGLIGDIVVHKPINPPGTAT